MVENRRGQEGRNVERSGPVHNESSKIHHLYPNGFEGMNYEQKREPYRGNCDDRERENGNGDNQPAKRRNNN